MEGLGGRSDEKEGTRGHNDIGVGATLIP